MSRVTGGQPMLGVQFQSADETLVGLLPLTEKIPAEQPFSVRNLGISTDLFLQIVQSLQREFDTPMVRIEVALSDRVVEINLFRATIKAHRLLTEAIIGTWAAQSQPQKLARLKAHEH